VSAADEAQVLVCRRIFPETLARLREHFEVEANDADDVWSRAS
jgi:gluconate 2-dehydrogenase